VVENSTHVPMIEGLNPAAVTDRERMAKSMLVHKLILGSTVIEHSTHNPKNGGSNPAN